MNVGAILVSVLARISTALFTEKVIINLIVMLAEWVAKRTKTDLDDRLVEILKDALDKDHGKPVKNLYDQVKASR